MALYNDSKIAKFKTIEEVDDIHITEGTSVGGTLEKNSNSSSISNVSTYTSYVSNIVISEKLEKKNNAIEVVQNNIEVINENEKLPEINLNDLISKGKLTFNSKIYVSYSYAYNLINIIPNPLYNELINNKYCDEYYATGYLTGADNTTYLKLNKKNIVNNISDDYYLPSIGELGISMENIQIINDSIDALGEEYSDYKIPYDAIIASSSLYSSTPINNDNYHITNNLNNVWCFNNKDAEITYKPISNKFTVIPFYKFENNNMVINLNEEIEDVVINSILTFESQMVGERYCEPNTPIHNFKVPDILDDNKASDFNPSNWFEHPFNSKYFFNILFPEIEDYISKGDNFTDLHNDYLSFYTYNINNYNIEIKQSTTTTLYSYYDIENNIDCKQDIHSNNGITLPSYLDTSNNSICTKTDDFWKQYLIYNVPIYDNHMVLMPIYGSGENNYNFKKNKAEVLLYVTIPISCSNFDCKMNNTIDCNIQISKYQSIKSFDIYCVELYFKEDVPTDNVLIFSCKYKNQTITKKYFYSIYSLTWSGLLNNQKTTYFNIDNFYVAKDPYYWWRINNWNKLNSNWKGPIKGNYTYYIVNGEAVNYATSYTYTYSDRFGKLFDGTYYKSNNRFYVEYMDQDNHTYSCYITYDGYRTKTTYLLQNKYNTFKDLAYSYFNIMYDMSYMINHISKNIRINDYDTVENRGLRVDRLIDNDINCNINKQEIKFTEGEESIYCYYIENEFKPNLNNYHLFTINSYFCSILSNDSVYKKEANEEYKMNEEDRTYFKPIIRINRTIDNFGIYNDLIFSDINFTEQTTYIVNTLNNTCEEKILTKHGEYKEYKLKDFNGFYGNPNNGEPNTYNYFEYSYEGSIKPANLVWYNRNNIIFEKNNNIVNNIVYLNKYSLNIPIVGAKQSICLGLDMIEYIKSHIFKNDDKNDDFYYYNYVFSDYLFLYNNTNNIVTLLISDPSLSLVNKQHALLQLKPKELKLYYPNNFNYSAILNKNIYDNEKIYSIKLTNKSSSNIIFEQYKLGELNKSFDTMKRDELKIENQDGYKLVTNLIYLNYIYNHNNDISYDDIFGLYNKISQENSHIKEMNEINIDIKNYNQNKAGHLVIINTNTLIK